jgi:hypothetical protein
MHCPAFQTLVEFVDGFAPENERESVERHLSEGCVECASAVRWYMSVRSAARADNSTEPPPWVTARTVAAIHDAREAARSRGLVGFLARIHAALVADSLSPEPAYSRGPGDGRQLLYSAEPFDVDLLVAAAVGSNHLRVAGQVLAADDDTFENVTHLTVELERDGRIALAGETSEIGEFSFDDVAPGRYEIHILGEWREIVLADVPLTLE